MSAPPASTSSKRKKRSLKPLPPRSPATMPDGARRPRPPPRVATPPIMCPPSPSWSARWDALFDTLLQQEPEGEAKERGRAADTSMDSGNVDGVEDDAPEHNVIFVEGSEEQQAARKAFEELLKAQPNSLQEYQANWDLAPWPANVDPVKRKVMIEARVRKMNGAGD
ncbi:hypothetical protein C8F04DRAFT_1261351 [Mycena alexandri]|uniref:Uncharacterized protein n=1 Tax=Mycena alexandri TaxID=1745969 RepID=A0AAD6SUQ4_9AGAR|nr:hypothetical protein C8F04DRAFT_1261351 [Mycena alexandri]